MITKLPTDTDTNSVLTTRNGIIENKHTIHAAITNTHGTLLYSIGDPQRITLARSAAKPAQALAVLETGIDCYGFDEADLALMCASHSSEDRHVARARAMLVKSGATEGDLRCGSHTPLSGAVDRAWIRAGFEPTAVCSNCSGKHAGMLAGCWAIGAEVEGYYLPDHPVQVRVKRVVEELCGLRAEEVMWGIDGCNLPAPAAPLCCLGSMYARFADAVDKVESTQDVSPREMGMARIFNAMARYPEMVGGEGRFCTILLDAFDGALIGKLGADGCYAIGIRASEQTRRLGTDSALGISVKVEDGSIEILYAVVAEILEQLGIGTDDVRRRLDTFHHLKRVNTVGVVTGDVSFNFQVHPYDSVADTTILTA